MTHRGPFQPLPFCDSVMLKETTTLKHRKTQQARLPRKKSFHALRSPTKPQEASTNASSSTATAQTAPLKCLLLEVPNKFLSLDIAMQLKLTLFH